MVVMASPNLTDTDELLNAAQRGDASARGQLLERHRPRLKRMVAVRIDSRVAARVDPSDVVQDALLAANTQLDNYLRDRPIPFYPWLRRLAWERVKDAYRIHVRADCRSVKREAAPELPNESINLLAERFLGRFESPSSALKRRDRQRLVRAMLDQLADRDREILVLRYLEDLDTAEAAAVLGVTESAAKVRLYRAMQRLRDLLTEETRP
jgi:RNA polymerase sigma-70 factor (ECF subfamily)